MYGKHFASMYSGSLFGKPALVFAVLGYVISNQRPNRQNQNHYVELNAMLLAATFATTPDEVLKAIEFLCAPDPYSRSQIAEGRRLIPLETIHSGPCQFQVVNGPKYRAMRDEEERRDYLREAKRVSRARQRENAGDNAGENVGESGSTDEADCHEADHPGGQGGADVTQPPMSTLSTTVNKRQHRQPSSTQAEAEADAEADLKTKAGRPRARTRVRRAPAEPQGSALPASARAPTGSNSRNPRPDSDVPETWTPNQWHRDYATEHDIDLDREIRSFRRYQEQQQNPMTDVDAAFQGWLRDRRRKGWTKQRRVGVPDAPSAPDNPEPVASGPSAAERQRQARIAALDAEAAAAKARGELEGFDVNQLTRGVGDGT